MDIKLEIVKEEDKDILFRLLQYSLFEESENDFNEMNQFAIFEYKYFDLYFYEKDRIPFFIKEVNTNKILGFAMVNKYLQIYQEGHSIAEFMVIPKYRRQKIGKCAVFKIFEQYPGNWEVKPSLNSDKSFLFWKNVIDAYTNGNYEIKNGLFLFTK